MQWGPGCCRCSWVASLNFVDPLLEPHSTASGLQETMEIQQMPVLGQCHSYGILQTLQAVIEEHRHRSLVSRGGMTLHGTLWQLSIHNCTHLPLPQGVLDVLSWHCGADGDQYSDATSREQQHPGYVHSDPGWSLDQGERVADAHNQTGAVHLQIWLYQASVPAGGQDCLKCSRHHLLGKIHFLLISFNRCEGFWHLHSVEK